MTNEKHEDANFGDEKFGKGILLGAGLSSMATAAFAAATFDKSMICLYFVQAAVAATGLTKAICAFDRRNSASANLKTPNGPGS